VSKLTDKLRRVGTTEATPMGFGFNTATRAKAAQLAVVAELPSADRDAIARAVADGADAVLLAAVSDDAAVKAAVAAAGSAPLGVRAGKNGRTQLEAWQKEGVDFFVFEGLDTPATALRLDGPARLLALDMDWPEAVWRTLEAASTDGGYYRLNSDLTLGALLNVVRANGVSRRNLILSLDATDEDTLTSLRDAGLVCIGVSADRVAAAKQVATDMPPRKRRDREHMDAMLPPGRVAAAAPVHEHDEEEE